MLKCAQYRSTQLAKALKALTIVQEEVLIWVPGAATFTNKGPPKDPKASPCEDRLESGAKNFESACRCALLLNVVLLLYSCAWENYVEAEDELLTVAVSYCILWLHVTKCHETPAVWSSPKPTEQHTTCTQMQRLSTIILSIHSSTVGLLLSSPSSIPPTCFSKTLVSSSAIQGT